VHSVKQKKNCHSISSTFFSLTRHKIRAQNCVFCSSLFAYIICAPKKLLILCIGRKCWWNLLLQPVILLNSFFFVFRFCLQSFCVCKNRKNLLIVKWQQNDSKKWKNSLLSKKKFYRIGMRVQFHQSFCANWKVAGTQCWVKNLSSNFTNILRRWIWGMPFAKKASHPVLAKKQRKYVGDIDPLVPHFTSVQVNLIPLTLLVRLENKAFPNELMISR